MSLSAMLRSQVMPGIPGPGEDVLRLAVEIARTTRDHHLLARATMTNGCPEVLADEVWGGDELPALVLASGNLLPKVAMSPEGFERMVGRYLEQVEDSDTKSLQVVAAALKSRIVLSRANRTGEDVTPLRRAGQRLSSSAPALRALAADPRIFDDLGSIVEDREKWLVQLAAQLDLSARSHSLIAVRIAQTGQDAAIGALPWGIPALDARGSDPYLAKLLGYVAKHCAGRREREVLVTLGEEWSGNVQSLVDACNQL